jgi:hypothetical protein
MIPDTPDIAYPITLPLHIDFDAGIDDPEFSLHRSPTEECYEEPLNLGH